MTDQSQSSTNVKIAEAASFLIIAGIIGNILSLVKEMIVAEKFGITRGMDAFYAAISIPTLINGVLLSSFGAIFIPFFVKWRLKDKDEANHIAAIVINYFLLFFIFMALVIFALAPWIIKYGFHGFELGTSVLAVKMLRLACLTLIFSGLIGIMTGILNAQQHFAWPAISQMFITLCTIFFILFFTQQWGVYVLIWGLLIGLIIQTIFLMPITGRRGYSYRFDLNWKHPAVKEMLLLLSPYFFAIVMGELNTVTDKVMASYLSPGSLAALGYASKLINVPLIIISSSMATAVFSFFSFQVASNNITEMKDSLAKSIRMSCFIFTPITVMTILLARPLMQLLFQRGSFTAEATDLTAKILICYSFQFLFYPVGVILGRVFLALQDMVTLLTITVLGVIMNITLNMVFMKFITPPVAGIALSTSVVYLITMSLFFVRLRKKMVHLHSQYILAGIGKIIMASLVAGMGSYVVSRFINQCLVPSSIINQLTRIGIVAMVACVLFVGSAVTLKIEETGSIWKLVKNKLLN
ncbi:MAG: murein biosynthesis integral membrane protein MurJ [Elusimicrobia bacterium]|nr:murein biosynthesis integral membrane protein MurJ [Elusimicrobiota bacterium]